MYLEGLPVNRWPTPPNFLPPTPTARRRSRVCFFLILDKFLQQISFLLDMRNEKGSGMERGTRSGETQGLRSVHVCRS